METVLCAARCVGDKVVVDLIDESKDFAWVQESLKTMKTPKGDELKPCCFHSGHPGDDKNGFNTELCVYYANKNAPLPYSIWVKGGNCYDICHLLENKHKEDIDKERRICGKILNNYITREQNVMKTHKEFFVNLDYLETLKNSIPLLDKEIELRKKPLNKDHPGYKTLEQLRDMAYNLLKQREIPHRRVYDKTDKLISFDEYLKKNCPEVEALERAEEKLENWINVHTPPPPSDLISKRDKAIEEIRSVEEMLQKQWKLPYAMIWMLRNDIQRAIYSFGTEKEMYGYQRDHLNIDIKYFDSYLGCYHKYMKGKKPIDIVKEIDREQNRAIRLEKEQKNLKSVQKIETVAAFVPVVCLDGTTSYQSTSDTYIANSTANTGSNEEWRAGAGGQPGKLGAVKYTVDDSKWERVR